MSDATAVTDRILGQIAYRAELPVANLRMNQTLEEIGLDSLHLTEIAMWAQKELGVLIADGDLFYDQTLEQAVARLRTGIG